MSTNIDKSLGEIISSRKSATRGRGRTRRGGARAPVGGVAKSVAKPTKANKPNTRAAAAPVAPAGSKGNKKIMVSGLPSDVKEHQIKEYFGERVGPISRIEMSYGPDGKFRGTVTILFRGDVAQKAVEDHNGVRVDGKAMKVEVVYDAKHLPPTQPVKSLGDRVSDPKKAAAAAAVAAAKKKNEPKKAKAAPKSAGAKEGRGGKGGRAGGRTKKKTADELDAEMADYFDSGKAANGEAGVATAAQPAAAAAAAAAAPAPATEAMDDVL